MQRIYRESKQRWLTAMLKRKHNHFKKTFSYLRPLKYDFVCKFDNFKSIFWK